MMSPSEPLFTDARTPADHGRNFLPGAGHSWLLPLYDPMHWLTGVGRLQRRAVQLAGIQPGQNVLDVGCGTGSFSFAVLAHTPDVTLTGLDPDPAALRRAAKRARRRRLRLDLARGYADHLPAGDSTVDHVISSFALHHVDDDGRAGFAAEARRVLVPGGRVTILDFGDGSDHGHTGPRPDSDHGVHSRHGSRRDHGGHARRQVAKNPHTARNLDGAITELLSTAGFTEAHQAEEIQHRRLGFAVVVQATAH